MFQETPKHLYFEKKWEIDFKMKDLCLFKVFKPAVEASPHPTIGTNTQRQKVPIVG